MVFISEFYSYQCHLLITFANSLDQDQARQNVGPDLDPSFVDPDLDPNFDVILERIFEKKKMKKLWVTNIQ